MTASQLQHALEDLRFSADMPRKILDQLAAVSAVQQVSVGAILFREGNKNDNLYLVRSGRIALEMKVPGRGTVRILTVGPGDMVGWSALLSGGKMTASAVAVEDSEVVVAPSDKLRVLCESNHEFGYHLMHELANALSKRLVATRLQLLDLFAGAPEAVPASRSAGET